MNLLSADISSNLSTLTASPASPTVTGSLSWEWQNISEASVTSLDLEKKDDSDDHLFYAGIMLGIAGSGIFALIPEVSQSLRRRHPEDDPPPTPSAGEAALATPKTGKSSVSRYGLLLAAGAVLGVLAGRRAARRGGRRE